MAVLNSNDPKNPKPLRPAAPSRSGFSPSGRPLSRRDDEPPALSMSGIRSGLLNSLLIKIAMGLLIAIFAIGFGISSLQPTTGLGGAGNNGAPKLLGGGPDPVARVGDEDIPRDRFQRGLAQQVQTMQQYGLDAGPAAMLNYRQSTLEGMTSEAAQYQAAKSQNITADDAEIDKKIDEYIDEKIKPQPGQTEAAARRDIESQFGSIDNYKTEQRKLYVRDLVARQLIIDKLQKKIKDANKVTEEDYKKSVTKLDLRVLKISPKPSVATPKSPIKEPKAAQEKTDADAKARAQKLAQSLSNATPAVFAAAVKANSDDIATKAKGGALGLKLPAELPYPPAVRDALVNAKTKVVGPLTTDELSKDQYIFLIGNRQLELPKDYAKKSKEYLKTFEASKDNEAWQKWQDDLKKKTTPEVLDPALAAYKIQTTQLISAQGEAKTQALNEAIGKYNEALEYASPVETSTIQYQLSQLYREANQPQKQLEALKIASENRDAKQAKIEYARALRDAKKPDEASAQLTELSKHLTESPAQPSMFGGGNPDDSIRFQIASEFDALGKKDLANAERAQVKPPAGAPGGMNFGNMGGMPGGLKMGSPGTVKMGKISGAKSVGGKGGPTIELGNVSTGGAKTITIPAPRAKP